MKTINVMNSAVMPSVPFHGSDADLLELAELYISAADNLRTYVEARRLARESFEHIIEASYLPEVAA